MINNHDAYIKKFSTIFITHNMSTYKEGFFAIIMNNQTIKTIQLVDFILKVFRCKISNFVILVIYLFKNLKKWSVNPNNDFSSIKCGM